MERADVRARLERVLAHEPDARGFLARVLPAEAPCPEPVEYSPALPASLGVLGLCASHPALLGGGEWMTALARSPTACVKTLRRRQRAATGCANARAARLRSALASAAPFEKDVAWILTRPPLRDAWPMALLFPTWPLAECINRAPAALALYHAFRVYVAPLSSALCPLLTLLGPWVYLRHQLGYPVPLAVYARLVSVVLREALRPTGEVRRDAAKYATLLAYAALYAHGVVQSVDLAIMIHRFRAELSRRADRIRAFLNSILRLLAALPARCVAPFLPPGTPPLDKGLLRAIPPGLRGVYAMWTDTSVRASMANVLRHAYAADVALAAGSWVAEGWCEVRWGGASARMWGALHPALGGAPRANPVLLDRSIVLTGPNAAGKSTYAKAVCANLWLAQTFGIARALRATMRPFRALGCFSQVSDAVGEASLFEAEARRCAELVSLATRAAAAGHSSFFLLDEPMRSAPPQEGAATAVAVVEHLGSLAGARVVVTTHYREMTALASQSPDRFRNLCMTAERGADGAIAYPYVLGAGASFQCVALDLLAHLDLPEEVARGAAEVHRKICGALSDARPGR